MVERKTWKEFQETKLLWWVNRTLHLFGWAIVIDIDEDGNVTDAYPARVKFRGFESTSEESGFKGLSKYLKCNSEALYEECL
jgi:hypothetical protein